MLAKKAFELTDLIYDATENFKDFALKDQLRRAGISTMNNIAEGFGRTSPKEKFRFFEFTTASCLEIEFMTYLLEKRNLIDINLVIKIRLKSIETFKVTAGFSQSVKKRKNVITRVLSFLF